MLGVRVRGRSYHIILQESCSAEFLTEHNLLGVEASVLQTVNKEAMLGAYKV